jgi:small-conductance mechanosensitive channel
MTGEKNLPDEVKDSINTKVSKRFAAEGIEIPLSQMEVRMKNNRLPFFERKKCIYD